MKGNAAANSLNIIASYYNDALGISIPKAYAGNAITSSRMLNMHNLVSGALVASGRYASIPNPAIFGVGQPIQLGHWGAVSAVSAPANTTTSSFTGSYTWLVPTGVTSVCFPWVVGGGGSGGWGSISGGGGGGSGGWETSIVVACNPGDKFQITIGSGGKPNPQGGAGSNFSVWGLGNPGGTTTVVYQPANGSPITVAQATGGQGGKPGNAGYFLSYSSPADGGIGGSPNGRQGQASPAGEHVYQYVDGVEQLVWVNDFGGGGAPGPTGGSLGGAGGNGNNGGQNGKGWGSGGGGGSGGYAPSSGVVYAQPGSGDQGYVEIVYPATSAAGVAASPAQDATGYSTNAIVNAWTGNVATSLGGGMTGGAPIYSVNGLNGTEGGL